MSYRIQALNTGEVEAMESILFHKGDSAKFRKIGCFAWLLQKGQESILIDTGIKDLEVVNKTKKGPRRWTQSGEQTIGSNLERLRLRPGDIGKVILTHSHYDHISNISLFNNADVYMSAKEYEYLFDDDNEMRKQLEEAKKHIRRLKQRSRLFLAEESMGINSEISIRLVGGHTPGSLMVFADTVMGKCVMTGDAVFLTDNIRRQLPIGLTKDHEQSVNALNICSKFTGLCLPSHDLSILKLLEGDKTGVRA